MKNQNLIALAILAICWEEMLTHMTGTNSINLEVQEDSKIITTQFSEFTGTVIPSVARESLLNWINKSLEEHGLVILYTCGDNSMISIEDPNEYPTSLDEILAQSNIPELADILWIAYD